MSIKTPEQDRNEQLIRRLYYLAEAASKDTPKFVSLFADGGYFRELDSFYRPTPALPLVNY